MPIMRIMDEDRGHAVPDIRTIASGAADPPLNSAPLLLFAWLSPLFPVGAFAYSHGLEWAHEAGDVSDAAGLEGWLHDLATCGALRSDAVLLSLVYRATSAGDERLLGDLAELGAALAPSPERRLETVQQGNAFLKVAREAWPCVAFERLRAVHAGDVAYPVALGLAAAGHGVALGATLQGFGLAFLSNLVSAAIRLGIIGQTDGQRVLAALLPAVEHAAAFAATATMDDLGGACFRSDIASLRHETQYTRIFRS